MYDTSSIPVLTGQCPYQRCTKEGIGSAASQGVSWTLVFFNSRRFNKLFAMLAAQYHRVVAKGTAFDVPPVEHPGNRNGTRRICLLSCCQTQSVKPARRTCVRRKAPDLSDPTLGSSALWPQVAHSTLSELSELLGPQVQRAPRQIGKKTSEVIDLREQIARFKVIFIMF